MADVHPPGVVGTHQHERQLEQPGGFGHAVVRCRGGVDHAVGVALPGVIEGVQRSLGRPGRDIAPAAFRRAQEVGDPVDDLLFDVLGVVAAMPDVPRVADVVEQLPGQPLTERVEGDVGGAGEADVIATVGSRPVEQTG
jgi:hypothetical protein